MDQVLPDDCMELPQISNAGMLAVAPVSVKRSRSIRKPSVNNQRMILFGKREIEICAKPATKRGNCRKTNRVTYAAIKRDCPRALQPQRFGGLSKLVPLKVPDLGAAIAASRSGHFCGNCGTLPAKPLIAGFPRRGCVSSGKVSRYQTRQLPETGPVLG